jgi:hypothetical protein
MVKKEDDHKGGEAARKLTFFGREAPIPFSRRLTVSVVEFPWGF